MLDQAKRVEAMHRLRPQAEFFPQFQRKGSAQVPLGAHAMVVMFALYLVISVTGGLTFNTILIAVPKIVDERIGENVPLLAIGGISTAVFLCGAIGQLAVGRLIERMTPAVLFIIVVVMQVAGCLWAATTNGLPLVIGLAVTMAGIYGQVTVGDIVIARDVAGNDHRSGSEGRGQFFDILLEALALVSER